MADAKKSLRKKRGTAKAQFHRFTNTFAKEKKEVDNIEVLKLMMNDLESAYKEMETKHQRYTESLDSGDEDDKQELTEKEEDIEKVYQELCAARTEMAKLVKNQKPTSSEASTRTRPTVKTTEQLKIKRLDTPTFSGRIRDYPSFKHDFENHVVVSYGKDPFALKGCLSGEALTSVKGVDNDYDEMFRRLDLKYGRPEKLTDAVLAELKRLKRIPDNDYRKFVSMVDVVERCWLDLKRLDLETEMNTTTMISQIERLLPSIQKREWSLQKHRAEAKKHLVKFPDFLHFLLEEKQAMEYMEDDMREMNPLSITKGKIHNAMGSVEEEFTSENSNDDSTCLLQNQIQENQKAIQQVIEGLAQVTKVMSQPNHFAPAAGTHTQLGLQRKRCWFHNTDNHEITQCTGFSSQENKIKVELIKKNGACFSCLKSGHIARNCTERKQCGILLQDGKTNCGKYHHSLLHLASIEGFAFHNSGQPTNKHHNQNRVLLMVSSVKSRSQGINTLWDPGANVSLISHDAARRLGLKGSTIELAITKVGNTTDRIKSKEYTLPLTDTEGKVWQICVYGMDEVTTNLEESDVSKVVHFFPEISLEDIERPKGKIELLIGADCCELLPNKVNQIGSLQLMKNQFGHCLRGSHPNLGSNGKVNHVVVKIHFLNGRTTQVNDLRPSTTRNIKNELDLFFNVESLGTHCIPKCGECRCGKCAPGSRRISLQEERELKMIKDGLRHDPEQNVWTIQYPWIKDPHELPNNFPAAFSQLKTTEKRLKKLGESHSQAYDLQVNDMINRGIAKKLTSQELSSYQGPVHYIPHHEVMKPDSKSTPIRIVFNSSSSYMGHKLNDYWAKGPNMMNDLLGVLVRFRQGYVAMANDIAKMYNTVRLSPLDQSTHRFLWRNFDQSKPPDHYQLSAVTFGDKPSGAIALVALQKTAELGKTEYPEAADVILKNSYVDDILNSTDSIEDVNRLASEVEALLAAGGFKLKDWIISKGHNESVDINRSVSNNLNISETKQEKVLGMLWDPHKDFFKFQVKVNFSLKQRKQYIENNLLSPDDLKSHSPTMLTRRMVVSQAARVYDPLGLVIPATLLAKVLIRKLCMKGEDDCKANFDWDEIMPEQMKKEWLDFFTELYQLESLQFPRCVKPLNATMEQPWLIVFSDGSQSAYGTCAYIRWMTKTGRCESFLLAAKNRIAPIRQLTIPRLELCGAVLASRLRESLLKEMNITFGRVIHLIDSMIVRAQIQKESYRFKPFVATRLGEIQETTKPSEWWCIPSEENPADLTTRITKASELKEDSMWQRGPKFLEQPVELWPIRKEEAEKMELPDNIVAAGTAANVNVKVKETETPMINLCDIKLENFKSYEKLIRVTSMLLKIAKQRSFKCAGKKISQENIREAESTWITFVQKSLPTDWKIRFQRLGVIKNDHKVIVVGSRIENWMKATWNQTSFPLLPAKHLFTQLVILSMHNKDHLGVESTLAKLRARFWVPQARRIIRSIKSKCVNCRKKEKILCTQEMGQIPPYRLQPSPPFLYTAVDLFGPFTIRDTVKKRTHGKAYGVIFNCLTTRAVYIDLADGYDTDSFILVLRRFISIRGNPRKVRSDPGSQLIAAGKEIRQIMEDWNWDKIHTISRNERIEWDVNKSANAPWENGCSESLIKSVKRNLTLSIGTSILSFSDLQTILFESANLLNERPIGTKTTDPNEGSYLCPNDIILGRATSQIPAGSFEESCDTRKRWIFVQQIINTFWKKWQRDYFHTLLIRQKWHTATRNLSVGDIVMVQDSTAMRGQWKLAQVAVADPGSDGKVRDVSLRYKHQNIGARCSGQQDVLINRSIHKLVLLLPVEEQL